MIFLRLLGVIAQLLIDAYERHVRRRELHEQPVYRPTNLPIKEQPDEEERRALFAKGARYRVRKTFKSQPSLFVEGEELMFESMRHDPHDGLFAYIFASQLGEKTWLLSGEDPIDTWKDYVEPL